MTDPIETADKIRRLTVDLERAREDLDFIGRSTLPDLRRQVEHHKDGKQRWRDRAKKAEARIAELEAASAVVPAADRAALDRRERYAAPLYAIMRENGWDGERTEVVVREMDLVLDAVIAVADAEQAELSAPADRAAVLTQAERDTLTHALNLAEEEILSLGEGDVETVDSLRRMAVESAAVDQVAAETPPADTGCVHCGHPVRRITGTLATWWVHDPGGHTVCNPQQAATSPRATPGPAVVAQPGKDTETPQPKEA
jgi:hypothetical protein